MEQLVKGGHRKLPGAQVKVAPVLDSGMEHTRSQYEAKFIYLIRGKIISM